MLIKALVINFVKDLVNDLISLPDPMEKDVELFWGYLYPLFETQVWTGSDVVALFQIVFINHSVNDIDDINIFINHSVNDIDDKTVFVNNSVNDVNDITDKNVFVSVSDINDINVFVTHFVNDSVNDINDINDINVFVTHFVNDFVNNKINNSTKSRNENRKYSTKWTKLIENKSVVLSGEYLQPFCSTLLYKITFLSILQERRKTVFTADLVKMTTANLVKMTTADLKLKLTMFETDRTIKLMEKDVELFWGYLYPFCSTFFSTFFTFLSILQERRKTRQPSSRVYIFFPPYFVYICLSVIPFSIYFGLLHTGNV